MSRNQLFEKYPELKIVKKNAFPSHIMIIPDGNGRWAQQKEHPVLYGHKKGAQQIQEVLRDLQELTEVKIVTVWGFSTDNWKREKTEIKGLLTLMLYQIKQTIGELHQQNRRFIHLGRKDRLSRSLYQSLVNAEELTKNNTGQIVCIAIDFGGEDQELRVVEAARQLPRQTMITRELLWQLRDGKGLIPPADLLIRTAGEKRTSDIGWLNGAPTELFFIEKLFPDITAKDIITGIVDFSKRERRFGGRK